MVPLHRLNGGVAAVLAAFVSCRYAVVLEWRAHPGVKVSYKQTQICETTPDVKAYAGYVILLASLDKAQPYESNLFFWFFESRNSPSRAPLAVWLQGGPGSASIDRAVSGHNGPCIVQRDSKTTKLNPWSWTNRANMLYIDQPMQTGFSYDSITPGVLDMLTGNVDVSGTNIPLNWTVVKGKFASQDPGKMANTTAIAARAIYHFLQLWFEEFQQYRCDEIGVWFQSYGGHYAPAIASLLRSQGVAITSVGIINGLIDLLAQAPFYPAFAVNNTYGIQAYNQSVADEALANLNTPGGCGDLARACRQAAAEGDRQGYGNNATVLELCQAAVGACWLGVYYPYEQLSGRNPFDIGHLMPDAFPPQYALGYLNQPPVQQALGAKVNYTTSTAVVGQMFVATGDFIRGRFLDNLASLVDQGVKIALVYGDRDFRCNWVGGEAASIAMNYSQKAAFATAEYANISINATYTGGVVRQHGLFSFSRVFQAGHEVPLYQPETAYQIFSRTLSGQDVATGRVNVARSSSSYSTSGPSSVAGIANAPPPQPANECYVLSAPLSSKCTPDQTSTLLAGSAVVKDYIVISPAQ